MNEFSPIPDCNIHNYDKIYGLYSNPNKQTLLLSLLFKRFNSQKNTRAVKNMK